MHSALFVIAVAAATASAIPIPSMPLNEAMTFVHSGWWDDEAVKVVWAAVKKGNTNARNILGDAFKNHPPHGPTTDPLGKTGTLGTQLYDQYMANPEHFFDNSLSGKLRNKFNSLKNLIHGGENAKREELESLEDLD